MRRQVIILAISAFIFTLCISFHVNAQVLPTWALNPWGNTLGLGNAATPPYTIYNTAAAYSPLVPLIPYPTVVPTYDPYYAYGYGLTPSPALVPPTPSVRTAAATITLVLPTGTVVPGTVPVVSAPIITTTQLFLGLLLTIGEESGLFYTNPALFWYIVGILY